MEIIVLLSLAATGLCLAFFGTSVALAVGVWYGKYYHDGSESDGRRNWPAFRSLSLWRYVHRYFRFQIIQESVLDPGPKLFAYHPHGLFTAGPPLCLGTHGGRADVWDQDLRFGTLRAVFRFPLLREFALWLGSIDVNAASLKRMLTVERRSVLLVPGGVQEMCLAKPGLVDIYLGHEGFLRLAWEQGISVVPVFGCGEEDVWWTWQCLHEIRRMMIPWLGYPFPSFGLGPLRPPHGIQIVVGSPLDPGQFSQMDDFVRQYWASLVALIHKYHRGQLGANIRHRGEKSE